MAAMRTALARLCRRSLGNSGSSVAASMGGRGLGIRQLVDPAAPKATLLPSLRPGPAAARTQPLPSLRPASVRNLEGWRRFSTKGLEGAGQDKTLLKHKAVYVLRMGWQRSRDSVKNVIGGRRSFFILLYIGSAAYLYFLASTFRSIRLHSRDTGTEWEDASDACVMLHASVSAHAPLLPSQRESCVLL